MLQRFALAALCLSLAACDSTMGEAVAPVLSECTVSESEIEPGDEVVFNAVLNGDAQEPVLVSIDWGDGDEDDVTTFPVSHTYNVAGTFSARVTAINALGSASCAETVEVSDPLCEDLQFAQVLFPFQSAVLDEKDLLALDRNALSVRQCSNVCLTIQAYTDDLETDQAALSQARADAVQDYYLSQGVARTRAAAQGLGQDPNANSAGTPGQGDFRARRAESVPGVCPQ